MKLLTWNMNHWQRAGESQAGWDHVATELKPDVALLQEAVPPRDLLDSGRVVYSEIGGTRRWGSAIYAREGLTLRGIEFEATRPGAAVAATVEGATLEGPLTVVSLYGLLEKLLGTEYSIPNLHRALSDLTGLLEDPARRGRIIVGGDFNASLQWDDRQGSPNHRLLLERLEAFGLESVLPYREGPTRTWRSKRGSTPWQLDHMFVSNELVPRVESATVAETSTIEELSDHNPIILNLA